jgi:oligosaccharide repeat unit polymerase
MFEILSNIPSQPATYLMALAFLLALITESAIRLRELRWGVAGIVYLTIGLWYFVDPVYRSEGYEGYTIAEKTMVYVQVLIFLVAFRLLVELAAPRTRSQVLRAFDPRELDNGAIIKVLLLVWVILFAIGMYRADFRFIDALFPLGARWQGAQMWHRARFGGVQDFFVSLGFYNYQLCCAGFGLIAVGTRRPNIRLLMVFLICLTWPMFALSGSRNTLLTVAIPAVLAVIILKRWSWTQRVLFLGTCLLVLNTVMLISITYRERGVSRFFEEDSYSEALEDAKHDGLNMPEELIYINGYQEKGMLTPEWGYEYFAQAVNFVPRFIWPGKPFPGEKFSALRVGYFQGQVAATISNGLVGQGVQNFGPWVGPLAPAVILSLLIRWMCRIPLSGAPVPRVLLVIFLMALIPNLGRDITLMNLWPAVFGFVGVRIWERTAAGRQMVARRKAASRQVASRPAELPIPGLPPSQYR